MAGEIILAKIAWSFSGWSGFDEVGYRLKNEYNYEFVKKYGLAFEWWNFDEDLDNKFYWGYIPGFERTKLDSIKKRFHNSTVIFISYNPLNQKRYVIGHYGRVVIPDTAKEIETLIPEFIKKKMTQKELQGAKLYLKAPKVLSMKFDKPIEVEKFFNQKGVEAIYKMGQAKYQSFKIEEFLNYL